MAWDILGRELQEEQADYQQGYPKFRRGRTVYAPQVRRNAPQSMGSISQPDLVNPPVDVLGAVGRTRPPANGVVPQPPAGPEEPSLAVQVARTKLTPVPIPGMEGGVQWSPSIRQTAQPVEGGATVEIPRIPIPLPEELAAQRHEELGRKLAAGEPAWSVQGEPVPIDWMKTGAPGMAPLITPEAARPLAAPPPPQPEGTAEPVPVGAVVETRPGSYVGSKAPSMEAYTKATREAGQVATPEEEAQAYDLRGAQGLKDIRNPATREVVRAMLAQRGAEKARKTEEGMVTVEKTPPVETEIGTVSGTEVRLPKAEAQRYEREKRQAAATADKAAQAEITAAADNESAARSALQEAEKPENYSEEGVAKAKAALESARQRHDQALNARRDALRGTKPEAVDVSGRPAHPLVAEAQGNSEMMKSLQVARKFRGERGITDLEKSLDSKYVPEFMEVPRREVVVGDNGKAVLDAANNPVYQVTGVDNVQKRDVAAVFDVDAEVQRFSKSMGHPNVKVNRDAAQAAVFLWMSRNSEIPSVKAAIDKLNENPTAAWKEYMGTTPKTVKGPMEQVPPSAPAAAPAAPTPAPAATSSGMEEVVVVPNYTGPTYAGEPGPGGLPAPGLKPPDAPVGGGELSEADAAKFLEAYGNDTQKAWEAAKKAGWKAAKPKGRAR